MNASEQSQISEPPQPAPLATEPAEATEPTTAASRQRRGKVARLLKAVRDRLNVMLLDGVPYAEILKTLGDDAKNVTEHNITTWAAGGYKDWLREQHRLEETRVKQEVAMDLACPAGGSRIHEATLQLAATSLSEMVRQLDCSDLKELLREDPKQLTPLLNALARISDAELRCERHILDVTERMAKTENNASKSAGLSTGARQEMERKLNVK
jgi:hypothetical protein